MSKTKTHVDRENEAGPPSAPHVKSLVHPFKAYDQIAQWERVWAEAIALAWKEWDKGPNSFRERLKKNPREAVRKEFDFVFPEDCNLAVEEGSPEDWEWDDASRMWKHPHAVSQLTLTLPCRPKNVEDAPIALANYIATGQSMPFTCCCC
ncbi:MAG: BMA_0021/BMA_0022 family TOMM bacteriocin [Myxococcales bacterium]|nr:BMA_0021/BMA_0022 family TOMM bacteriocin [Myxococcales bacterium]